MVNPIIRRSNHATTRSVGLECPKAADFINRSWRNAVCQHELLCAEQLGPLRFATPERPAFLLLNERPPAAVATSREGHRFSHEDRPQLSVALRMLRLRTIYRAENIGNVLKRVVNVCQQEFVNEVLGPLVTEFICNFGRENARPIQHAFHGGLLDPM